ETLAECGRRELMEETNLEVEVGRLLFISESIPPDGHRHVVNFFLEGRVTGGDMRLGADTNLSNVRYLPLAEFATLTVYPPVVDTVLRVARGETIEPI